MKRTHWRKRTLGAALAILLASFIAAPAQSQSVEEFYAGKALTFYIGFSVGGGGDLDRPLVMRRSMVDALLDQMAFAEVTNDYLVLASQGAWQYYDDLMYADSNSGGAQGAFGTVAQYDAAGILNKAFEGSPMLWDPSVTVPYGATASTEAFYFIHRPSYKVSIRGEKNFLFKGWEDPRVHDSPKTFSALLTVRYTPVVNARRPHLVCYNLPANPN